MLWWEINRSILAPIDSLVTSSLTEFVLLPPIPFSILLSAFPRLSLAFTFNTCTETGERNYMVNTFPDIWIYQEILPPLWLGNQAPDRSTLLKLFSLYQGFHLTRQLFSKQSHFAFFPFSCYQCLKIAHAMLSTNYEVEQSVHYI